MTPYILIFLLTTAPGEFTVKALGFDTSRDCQRIEQAIRQEGATRSMVVVEACKVRL